MKNCSIEQNPNKIITKLKKINLSNDEISVVERGLEHGVLMRPKELVMIAIVENILEQKQNHGILKNDPISKVRAKTALKYFAYNYLDLDVTQFISDNKITKLLRKLKDKCLILKPNKGEGIVLVNRDDCNNSLENLFNDTSKIQLLDDDPTIRNLSTAQSYLNTLYNRQKITLEDKDAMRPKFAQVGRAHGLPKIHKSCHHFSPFRPIIDATNTAHYGIVKYLSNLLHPLTENNFTVKDSFDAANKIQAIPSELFDEGYRFVSFDVTSLFTNVLLKRTIKIILKCIYEDKVVYTTLRKRAMKKLIIDPCTKTAFSFNNKIYKQVDGVSIGSLLGPVLVNIIITELEKIIVKDLVDRYLIKVYMRYVDDILLLVKEKDIKLIHERLNSFDKNIKFTIDNFYRW